MIRLVTIAVSHFCEKARWALDRAGVAYEEDGHLPMFHYLPTRRAGGKRRVPVLVIERGNVVCDSTEIVAWADGQKPGALLPIDPRDRAAAIAIEDDLDRTLGPATRCWAYFHMLDRKDLPRRLAWKVPAWEVTALTLGRPLAVLAMKRGLSINPASAERSRQQIDDAFARTNALLRDGRRYLAGDAFSVADLTFAALAAIVLLPKDGHPYPLPDASEVPPESRDRIQGWRDSAAGRHALTMYRHERATRY